jgi:hypothetical protein
MRILKLLHKQNRQKRQVDFVRNWSMLIDFHMYTFFLCHRSTVLSMYSINPSFHAQHLRIFSRAIQIEKMVKILLGYKSLLVQLEYVTYYKGETQ